MAETIPDDATIRQMDGPALTRLAWEWGLAPMAMEPLPGQDAVIGLFFLDAPGSLNYTVLEIWYPHTNIAQADAVFRSLRARGWECSQTWKSTHRKSPFPEGEGYITVFSTIHHYCYFFSPDTEPLALLRCAVLAVAWEKRQEDATP